MEKNGKQVFVKCHAIKVFTAIPSRRNETGWFHCSFFVCSAHKPVNKMIWLNIFLSIQTRVIRFGMKSIGFVCGIPSEIRWVNTKGKHMRMFGAVGERKKNANLSKYFESMARTHTHKRQQQFAPWWQTGWQCFHYVIRALPQLCAV